MKSRQQRRNEIRERLVAQAKREAETQGRSMSCQWGRHETCRGGPEEHDTCLCECHDLDAPPPTEHTEEDA